MRFPSRALDPKIDISKLREMATHRVEIVLHECEWCGNPASTKTILLGPGTVNF